jgi:hypothetical protein
MSRRPRSPFAVVHDIDGPKVRLGFAWFVLVIGAALAHRLALGVVLAVAAALAADEVLRLHLPAADGADDDGRGRVERVLGDPTRLPVLLAGASLPLAAVAGSDVLAGALVATFLVLPVWRLLAARDAHPSVLPLAALAIPALGLAAAAPVLLHRIAPWAAVVLLVLVSAYDAGDFLVGTGAGTAWEGPAAGIAAVGVCAFVAAAFPLPPLEVDGAVLLGVLTALLAPFGPPLGSVLVGDGRTKARYVRRLDVLLLLAPVAAWATPAATGA